jgi:hypothetical protein
MRGHTTGYGARWALCSRAGSACVKGGVLKYIRHTPLLGCNPPRTMHGLLVRGGAVWQLVGLITRRSQVQILPPLPTFRSHSKSLETPQFLNVKAAILGGLCGRSVRKVAANRAARHFDASSYSLLPTTERCRAGLCSSPGSTLPWRKFRSWGSLLVPPVPKSPP